MSARQHVSGSQNSLPSLALLKHTPEPVGAPRGGRMAVDNDRGLFESDRRERLTASLLPKWMGLQGPSGKILRKNIVRVMFNNDNRYAEPPSNPFQAEMMKWGRDHEIDGIHAYMEITRHLVGLGSLRLTAEPSERIDDNPDGVEWKWSSLLAATPDGFVYDPTNGDPGMLDLGLLEVRCPAYLGESRTGVKRRHDPEFHIGKETDHFLLLQVWEQLEVCGEAQFVDMVHWKRDKPVGQDAEEYIWLQRIYRDERTHGAIKDILASSFGEFQRALDAIEKTDERNKELDAMDSDDTMDEELEDEYEARQIEKTTKMQPDGSYKDLEVRGYKANEADSGLVGRLKAQLDRWAFGSLCWLNTTHIQDVGYAWRSKEWAEQKVRDLGVPRAQRAAAIERVLSGFACRYQLSNGQIATHFGVQGDSGYTPLMLNSKYLFNVEVL